MVVFAMAAAALPSCHRDLGRRPPMVEEKKDERKTGQMKEFQTTVSVCNGEKCSVKMAHVLGFYQFGPHVDNIADSEMKFYETMNLQSADLMEKFRLSKGCVPNKSKIVIQTDLVDSQSRKTINKTEIEAGSFCKR